MVRPEPWRAAASWRRKLRLLRVSFQTLSKSNTMLLTDLYDLYALNTYSKDSEYYFLLDIVYRLYQVEIIKIMSNRPGGRLWGKIIPNQIKILESLNDRMLYVDGINQLMHYHGMVISPILKSIDILDILFAALSPIDFWGKLSSGVRRKCWPMVHGQKRNTLDVDLIIAKLRRAVTIISTTKISNGVKGTYRRPYYITNNIQARLTLSESLSFSIMVRSSHYELSWSSLRSEHLNEGDKVDISIQRKRVPLATDFVSLMFPFNYGDMLANILRVLAD